LQKITTMPRSVNHVASRKRRKKILKMAKGYFGARSKVYTRAFRRLWIARINAAARIHGLSYSVFMHKLSSKGIQLNRKVLADMAMNEPDTFAAIVNDVK